MTIDIDQNELIGMIAEKLNVDRSNVRIDVHKKLSQWFRTLCG